MEILNRDRAHKWLGCRIGTQTGSSHGLDLEHHLQAASKVSKTNTSMLFDKGVRIVKQIVYFHAMVIPVACSASGNHEIYKQDLRKLDIIFFLNQIPQIRAHRCGPFRRLRLAGSMARSFTRGMHACWNVLNKLASNYGPGDAWNNIGN